MKMVFSLALVLGAATLGFAREPMWAPSQSVALQPTPIAPAPSLNIVPEGAMIQPTPATGVIVPGAAIPMTGLAQPGVIVCNACDAGALPLYPAVRVRAPRNIAPCAVEKIVSVPDPCNPCRCVLISICVPPCACERVKVDRSGDVTFDYGKYAVEVSSTRRGALLVSYKD